MNNETITVETVINAPLERVWECYTNPDHIPQWCSGSPDWHTPKAENDLKIGGRFLTRMEAKDGSAGFDLTGTYTDIVLHKTISYSMDGSDARHVTTQFEVIGGATRVTTAFDIEHENPIEMQRTGWQSILNNLKEHAESH